jgi:hypothetical protein
VIDDALKSSVKRPLSEVLPGAIRDGLLSSINLIDNYTRGRVAEVIVATACGGSLVGEGYGSWDVQWGDIRIEVKASGLVQSWPQARPARAIFSIAEATGWLEADAGLFTRDVANIRRSDVYVFAHHKGTKPDLPDEWVFYVVPTTRINTVCERQATISLKAIVDRLEPTVVDHVGLAVEVARAAAM